MKVLDHFDNAAGRPHVIQGDTITFDLMHGSTLNVLVVDPPPTLTVVLHANPNLLRHIPGQGLIVSPDGQNFRAIPWATVEADPPRLTALVPAGGRTTQLALAYPYGRNRLDCLMADTHAGHGRWDILRHDWRQVPVFRIGPDDAPLVHWIIAAEDAWETAAAWAADEMIRSLADGRLSPPPDAQICIVPVASPYSLTQPCPSYTDTTGKGSYGAATWADEAPPPEFLLLRDQVDRAIAARRLGLLLTIHSWHALRPFSGLETIRTAGANELSPARAEWAQRTMRALLRDVPVGQSALPEKIWHPGLAREWSLAKRNAITFRIELTTASAGLDQFRRSGRALLANIAAVEDWRPVCAPAD